MNKFGFLFEDGTVTEKDLEYIHSVPKSIQREACKEFGKTRTYLTAPSPENIDLRMFYNWMGAKIDDARNDTYEPFSRVRGKIRDLYDIVSNGNVRDLLVRVIMQDVHTIELLRDKALIPVFKIVQNNDDDQLKLFVLSEIIPFKLDDYHITCSDSLMEKDDNALLILWEHILEMWYMFRFDIFAKELMQFSYIIKIPQNIVVDFGCAVTNDKLDPDTSAWFSAEVSKREDLEKLESFPLPPVTESLSRFFNLYSKNGFSYDEFNENFRDKWVKILSEMDLGINIKDYKNPEDIRAEYVSQEAIFMILEMDGVGGIYPFVTVRDSLLMVLYGGAYHAAVEFSVDKNYLLFIPIEPNGSNGEIYYVYDVVDEDCKYIIENPFDRD